MARQVSRDSLFGEAEPTTPLTRVLPRPVVGRTGRERSEQQRNQLLSQSEDALEVEIQHLGEGLVWVFFQRCAPVCPGCEGQGMVSSSAASKMRWRVYLPLFTST